MGEHQELPAEGWLRPAPPDSGRNGERDFHGQKRSNETHAATADLDARLYRKSKARRRSSVSWGTR
jgi:hypothetical protein